MILQRSPWFYTVLLTLISAFLHLLVSGRIGLSADGAHYALYALHLDWSYFDHPPLVGWLQSSVLLFSESDIALRIIPISLFAASGLALYYLTTLIFPDDSPWLAFFAVVVLQAGVLFHLIALSMLPDGPLLLLGILAMAMLWRAVVLQQHNAWLYLGVCLGLAGLSKYTAITLVVTVALFLLANHDWRELRRPQLWLGIVIAFVLILPILLWNANHEWISFLYQLNHGFRNDSWQWGRFLLTQGAQFAVYSPVVYTVGLIALVSALLQWKNPAFKLLVLFVAPILLLFAWGAGFRESLPHWTSLAWAGLAPLTARWLMQRWHLRTIKVVVWFGISYSVVFILLLHSLLFYPWISFPEKSHPLQDLTGWPEAMERANQQLKLIETKSAEKAQLFVSNWSVASRAAWYGRPTPVKVVDQRVDQFDLWFSSPQQGDSGLMVIPATIENPIEEGDNMGFAECTFMEELPIKYAGQVLARYRYYHCVDFSPKTDALQSQP